MFTLSKLFKSNKIRVISYEDSIKNIFFSKIIKYDFEDSTKKEYLMNKYLIDRNNDSFENFNIYEEIEIKDISGKVELKINYKDENFSIELDICDLLDGNEYYDEDRYRGYWIVNIHHVHSIVCYKSKINVSCWKAGSYSKSDQFIKEKIKHTVKCC